MQQTNTRSDDVFRNETRRIGICIFSQWICQCISRNDVLRKIIRMFPSFRNALRPEVGSRILESRISNCINAVLIDGGEPLPAVRDWTFQFYEQTGECLTRWARSRSCSKFPYFPRAVREIGTPTFGINAGQSSWLWPISSPWPRTKQASKQASKQSRLLLDKPTSPGGPCMYIHVCNALHSWMQRAQKCIRRPCRRSRNREAGELGNDRLEAFKRAERPLVERAEVGKSKSPAGLFLKERPGKTSARCLSPTETHALSFPLRVEKHRLRTLWLGSLAEYRNGYLARPSVAIALPARLYKVHRMEPLSNIAEYCTAIFKIFITRSCACRRVVGIISRKLVI